MLEEKKIKEMFKMAKYEKKQGAGDFKIIKRYRFDYISYNTFKLMFFATIALFMLFIINFLSKVVSNMAKITDLDFISVGGMYLAIWIPLMIIYAIVGNSIYKKKYNEAKARVDEYEKLLNQLDD